MSQEPVQVGCYAGYCYPERPVFFQWEGAWYQIDEIVREWKEPGRRLFRVQAQHRLFQLCYEESSDRWWLTELVP